MNHFLGLSLLEGHEYSAMYWRLQFLTVFVKIYRYIMIIHLSSGRRKEAYYDRSMGCFDLMEVSIKEITTRKGITI